MKPLESERAFELVKAAIESNALKLQGPGASEKHSKTAAQSDAAYLLELMDALTKPPAQ